jgi:hypothetical protein
MAQDDLDNDAAFAQRAVSRLPTVAVPASLEARILAGFDAVAARRRRSLWNAPARLAGAWRDAVWPGAPAWKPATVLALSLAIGVTAGAMVPASALTRDDQTQVSSLDTNSVLDISGDL